MKDINKLYYNRFLSHVISSYETDLKQAQPGHCLKITGLALPELQTLIGSIRTVNPNMLVYILSDDLKGPDYISATKLIELRNSATAPLLMLIPAGSRTSAEDSYGDATFRNLNVAELQGSFLNKLIDEIPDDKKGYWLALLPLLKELKITPDLVVNYLLFVDDGHYEPEVWGDALFLLGMLPDDSLFDDDKNIRWRFCFNHAICSDLSDFSDPPADRIRRLPIKPQTIQNELLDFFFKEKNINTRNDIFYRIHDKYSALNFGKWPLTTESVQTEDVTVYAEVVPGKDREKELVQTNEYGLVLNLLPNKKAKVKLNVASSPAPKDCPDIVAFQILIVNRDNYVGTVIRKFKLTTNRNRSRTITVNIPYKSLENGNYMLAVHALNTDELVLDKDNPFKSEEEERRFQEALKSDSTLTRESYRLQQPNSNRAMPLTNETSTFYVNIVDPEDPENTGLIGEEDESGKKWNRANCYLQGYIRHRITHMKDKEELAGEEGERITEERESSSWIEGPLNNVFHFDFGFSEAFQIQLPKKLIFLEQVFLKYSNLFGQVHAKVGANPTDSKMKGADFSPLNAEIIVPDNLRESRQRLFTLISESAQNNTGVSATFDLATNVGPLKQYITDYANWLRELGEQELSETKALEVQNIDTVLLDVEKPDGSTCTVRLLTPLHPIRLAWQVNLLELFEDWEQKTKEYKPYEKDWFRNLENLFKANGGLPLNTAPLIMAEGAMNEPFQYVGELTYGWGFFAKQSVEEGNTFASELRQLLDYTATLMNVSREKRVDTDVSPLLVRNHIVNYAKAHPYTDKLVINLFNPGDALVFAATMLNLERNNISLDYEIRLFTDDDLIQPGAALNELLNPESSIADEAEAFAQASENRLFPKLRFSRNKVQDFLANRNKYQAHISFLINPFPVQTELVRQDELSRSFYVNGLVCNNVVTQTNDGKSHVWHRYYSEKNLLQSVTGFAEVSTGMFTNLQRMTAKVMSSTQKESVPSTALRLKESDAMLLSFVHDVSDWVVTFDKNMGPEFYDLPSVGGEEMPYLLDYMPSHDSANGISSFLTTRPTSEVEGVMAPCFKEFGIDIEDRDLFKNLLEDVRTVSGSIVMQANATSNKAFEVLGTTLTKRMLQKKGLLDETFIIPIDLHKDLFLQAEDDNKERADNLLVSFDVEKREIIITVLEIKCRQSLNEMDRADLETKILSQITNTITVLKEHFEIQPVHDRLDRELKTLEFKNLLEFYIKRSHRYNQLDATITMEYLNFLSTLEEGYELRFKQLGVIFDFSQAARQEKDYLGDLVIYRMGKASIGEILSDVATMSTTKPEEQAEDITNFFEPKHREQLVSRRTGKHIEEEPIEDIPSVDFGPVQSEHAEPEIPVEPEKPEKPVQPEEQVKPEESQKPIDPIPPTDPTPEPEPIDPNYEEPKYEMLIGDDKDSPQYGILGQVASNKRRIAIDLNKCNTISLFGVQGAGKSFTIGTVAEMTLKQFSKVNKLPAPMASVIFHYSESMDYAPEFTSMIYPNDDERQLALLKANYGVEPGCVKDVLLLAPESQVENRKAEYPGIEVHPIGFDSNELTVKDWMFLLGATGNDSTYIKELKQIMKGCRNNMTLQYIRAGVTSNTFLSTAQRNLALQRLKFAEEYINDGNKLKQYLRPGRLIIVDLRDEFIEKDEALGLFVVMLNIFSSVMQVDGKAFNKFIVFDEAHKYMNNRDLVDSIVTAIREMRHKGVSVMIASQDPMSLPTEIIELSSMVIMHKFNSPGWVKHVQKAIIALQSLSASEMSSLGIGEAYLWAAKSTDKLVTQRPIKISVRPRVTKHGGDTISAIK